MLYVYMIGILVGIVVMHRLDSTPETRRGWAMFGVWMVMSLLINLALHAYFFSSITWWVIILVWLMSGPLSYWRYLELRQRSRANERRQSSRNH